MATSGPHSRSHNRTPHIVNALLKIFFQFLVLVRLGLLAATLLLPVGDPPPRNHVHWQDSVADDSLPCDPTVGQGAERGAHHRGGARVQERALLDRVLRKTGKNITSSKNYSHFPTND